jgi:hypothetical protein
VPSSRRASAMIVAAIVAHARDRARLGQGRDRQALRARVLAPRDVLVDDLGREAGNREQHLAGREPRVHARAGANTP